MPPENRSRHIGPSQLVERAMALAQVVATETGAGELTAVHVVAGIVVAERGGAYAALHKQGLTSEAVLLALGAAQDVSGLYGTLNRDDVRDLPNSPALNASLKSARALARRFRSIQMDSEHVVLGVLRRGGGAVERFLLDLGIDLGELEVDLLSSIRVAGDPTPATRVDVLDNEDAAIVVAEFEPPFAAFTSLMQSGALPPLDEDFVRNTIQQVHLWRQRDDASPQIFELLIRDLVIRFVDRLSDPAPLESELLALGADEETAREVADRVAEGVRRSADLGEDDADEDASRLDEIAEYAKRVATAVESLDLRDSRRDRSLLRRGAESAAMGAGSELGKSLGKFAVRGLATLIEDHWSQIQVGLLMAWRAVKDVLTN